MRDGGAEAGQQEQTGGEAGTLAHLLTHSVSHCQFMFQTLQQLVRMVLYLGCKGQRAVLHHSGSGPNLDQYGSKQNAKCFPSKCFFYAYLVASTDKLLTYDVFCTPKATVMHAFINIIFCQTGAK